MLVKGFHNKENYIFIRYVNQMLGFAKNIGYTQDHTWNGAKEISEQDLRKEQRGAKKERKRIIRPCKNSITKQMC